MDTILLCGLNWIGDTLMSMPTIQLFQDRFPDTRISLLVKPSMVPLWEMHALPSNIIRLEPGIAGIRKAVKELRQTGYDRACILPNSFRSALVPFLSGIPVRTGFPGHMRDWMLSDVIRPETQTENRHQAYEYCALLLPDEPVTTLPHPELTVPNPAHMWAQAHVGTLQHPRFGLIPGAARGPSKRWPVAHFHALAKRLVTELGAGIMLFGTEADHESCETIARDLGDHVINFAGATDLKQWAALLALCDTVVANDSGGMHLAAAMGTRVVAIFGCTDPDKTGPLGKDTCIIQHARDRARDIPRNSKCAEQALASVSPEEVFTAAIKGLDGKPETQQDS